MALDVSVCFVVHFSKIYDFSRRKARTHRKASAPTLQALCNIDLLLVPWVCRLECQYFGILGRCASTNRAALAFNGHALMRQQMTCAFGRGACGACWKVAFIVTAAERSLGWFVTCIGDSHVSGDGSFCLCRVGGCVGCCVGRWSVHSTLLSAKVRWYYHVLGVVCSRNSTATAVVQLCVSSSAPRNGLRPQSWPSEAPR